MPDWYQLDAESTLRELRSDAAHGLSESEAARRRAEHGANELVAAGVKNPWRILAEQLTALMVVILIVAAVISALLGDYEDAIAIAAIVVLNAVLGFTQEYRAEKALAALKKLAAPSVRVRREGRVRQVPAAQLVPGDILLLEAGNFVAADGRVIESAELQVQEAALTGESEPVRKTVRALKQPDLTPGDRRNMVFRGTLVTAGRGTVVVTETGMRTELGRIAQMIQSVSREATPLQRRLDQLAKRLAALALLLVAVIFGLGLARGEELRLMFLTAVSLAVAAVPEGLPAVVTIALTLGAHRMLKRGALIRKLHAVETLGLVTVICSDKTGTLTENRMRATVLQLPAQRLDLAADSAAPGPEAPGGGAARQQAQLVLMAGALCNDAVLQTEGDRKEGAAALGDPTETALVDAAAHFGLAKPELERLLPRAAEVPFSSERKRMTTIHRLPERPEEVPEALRAACGGSCPAYVAFTKGAVESVLEVSSRVWTEEGFAPLDADRRRRLLEGNDALAADGMRVLGVAFRPLESLPEEEEAAGAEREMTFAGMIGLVDPPRPEATESVGLCRAAGIRPVMITGDHPLTARYIARQLGIAEDSKAITGAELERIPTEELEKLAEAVPVYARVSPEHKLKIVEALQRRRQIVAMTGDGVNDAPALKKADIGVAMGITGTDVTKEAADMVLMDDNFATIVAAVQEGRVIYDNIRKFIRYILATNSGEIWLMIAAPFLGMPLPLLPLQILWMNLVTDGLPALALGIEPPEEDAMKRPPHPPNETIFARGLGRHVVWVGLLMAALCLAAGYVYWRGGNPRWQTMIFTTLTLSQMAHVMAIRSERQSLFHIGLLSNTPMLGAVALTVLLQLALLYTPFLQSVFRTQALPARELLLAVAVSSAVFVAVELEKAVRRRAAA